MLSERPGDAVLPETVQGLIAARLDTLPARRERAALRRCGHRQGVLARRTRPGALDARGAAARPRARRSSCAASGGAPSPGRSSTAFATRSCATSPTSRSRGPSAPTSTGGRRSGSRRSAAADDHAEMLAHHYGAALEYARATGGDTGGFEERARAAFREAGDRAFGLNAFPAAARSTRGRSSSGRETTPTGPSSCFSLARAYPVGGDERREQALEDARQASLAAGLLEHAAEADALLAEVLRGPKSTASGCDRHIDRGARAGRGAPGLAREGNRAQPDLALPPAGRSSTRKRSDRRARRWRWRSVSGSTSSRACARQHRHDASSTSDGAEGIDPGAKRRARARAAVTRGGTRPPQPRHGELVPGDLARAAELFADAARVSERSERSGSRGRVARSAAQRCTERSAWDEAPRCSRTT